MNTKLRCMSLMIILFCSFFVINQNFVKADETVSYTYHFDEIGWYLISLPLNVEDNSVDALFGELIDEGKIDSHFFAWDAEKQSNNFTDYLYPGYGYQIHVNQICECIIQGNEITEDLSIGVYTGWNYLGWVYTSSTTAMQVCYHIYGSQGVSKYNDTQGNWLTYNYGSKKNNFEIIQGMGIACYVNTSSTWNGRAMSGFPPYLSISTNSSVIENEDFEVLVTSEGTPINNVKIEFDNKVYYTDASGSVTITAPMVDGNSSYKIYANKTGYVYDSVQITVINVPPEEYAQLEISASDSVNEEEFFQVTIKADGTPVEAATVLFAGGSYLTDGNGIVNLFAPLVDSNTVYSIDASKTGYISAKSSIIVYDESSEVQPLLSISAPLSVDEGEVFQIKITADDSFIEDAEVVFAGNSYKSDSLGHVTITAPLIDGTKGYTIQVSKTGYISNSVSILVIDVPEPQHDPDSELLDGWVYGQVYETAGDLLTPIKNVKICLLLSESNNVIKNRCVLTDDDGQFIISISSGMYTVQASKNGYNSVSVLNTQVESNLGKELNFNLQKISTTADSTLTDYTIENEKKSGSIGAEIDIEDEETKVDIYNDKVNVEVSSIEKEKNQDKITVVVSAVDEIGGTKLIFYLGQIDDRAIKIEYDGVALTETTDILSFFSVDNKGEQYAIFSSGEENIAVVNVPHFSEHEISIYLISPAEVVRYTNFVVIISAIIIALAAAFMLRKGKED